MLRTDCYRRRRANWQTRSAELRPTPYPQLAIEGPALEMEPPEAAPPPEETAGRAFEEAKTPQLQGPGPPAAEHFMPSTMIQT